jgi:hypothetical protein
MNKTQATLALLSVCCLAAVGLAQNEPNPAGTKFFHLDFVLKELDGAKVINSRAYSMTVSTVSKSTMKTGNKVPVQTGGPSNNLTYVDVGVNLECHSVREVQNELTMRISAESSSAVNDQPSAAPLIRQARWDSDVVVPLRKPTVIFSSDDPATKHQMQLELTASPIR